MTQHVMAEQTREDQETLRSLGKFIGLFALFAAAMALGVTFLAG